MSEGFNPLNAELNPICHLLALLGAHLIFHVSRIRVNSVVQNWKFEERYFDLELEEDTWSGIDYVGVTALTFASHLNDFAEKTSRLLRQPC
jgi:hypothetical protein